MNASAMRIEWDDKRPREVEEAKALYRQARAAGRAIVDLDGKPIESFRPYFRGMVIQEVALTADQFSIRILDETGDRRLIWNAMDPSQVKEAAEIFNEYVQKGWKAYAIKADGSRGRRIREFDAASQELVVDDETITEKLKSFSDKIKAETKIEAVKTVRERLDSFVKSFKQIKMLPKTYPG